MSMADRKTDGQLAAAPQRPPVPLPWAEIRGRGPAVVLLHGLADSHELWRNQIPVLEHRFRTIAVDHYGHGRSPLPPERLTTAVMADGVAALINAQAVAPAVVVGLSMGGGVAQVLALRRPDLVRALVLVSTGSDFPPGTRDRLLARAAKAEREGMAAVVDATVPRWFTPDFAHRHPEEIERTRAAVLANDPDAFGAASRANADRGWTDRLGEITCPVLFIGGEQDPADPVRSLAIYRDRLRDLTVALFPDVSHLVPVEAPDQFISVLVDFLDRVTRRGRPRDL
jgi:3-oxoadipate enol-lactonase